MKKIYKRLGFSLVELMVVVAVIVILTGIGAVALNKFNQNQNLDGKKEELMADLKLARNMAMTNQLPIGTSGSLKYVKLTLNRDVGVSAQAIVTNPDGTANYFSKENKTIDLAVGTTSIGFSIENGRLMSGNGVFASDPVCLTLNFASDPDDKKYIMIDISGLIYEKDSCP